MECWSGRLWKMCESKSNFAKNKLNMPENGKYYEKYVHSKIPIQTNPKVIFNLNIQ